jgi:hypothetical protein
MIDDWHFTLSDEDPRKVITAARYVAKTCEKGFAITPGFLLKASKELSNEMRSGEIAWNDGPAKAKTDFDRETWRLWGGSSRYGSLPDPKYCDDPADAHTVLSFARKEFLELYNARHEQDQKADYHITHSDAARLGANLAIGFDMNKFLGAKTK